MSTATHPGMKNKVPPWTQQQQEVISESADVRQLVIAGPGTGKTAVACARVAWLAAQGITPSTIMMFSFTRAAVAELRNRILQFSGNDAVGSVRISTLDSQAWHFRHGTGADFESLTGSFEENIDETIKLLEEEHDVLGEYLEGTSHLIVDETQDLTAARSRLVSMLIAKVPPTCGVTVFADPCQAIYGFTNDYEDGTSVNGAFVESYDFDKNGFVQRTLDRIHRTEDESLLQVFDAVRESVATHDPTVVIDTIKEKVSPLAGDLTDEVDERSLVLYRRRAQALSGTHFFPRYCRLRMSGLPQCIHPWIGAVLWRWTGNVIQLEEFVELWEDVADIDSLLYGAIDSSEAWNLLHHHAANKYGGVSLVRLRELLCRPRPHADFLIPDYGMWGPIFGTIHGSKGREADKVVLMLPKTDKTLVIPGDQPNAERRNAEEARVYYVGVTRAKESVAYDDAPSLIGATSVGSGRVWHSYQWGKGKPAIAKVQFGVRGDFDELALVSREFCASPAEAVSNTEALLNVHRDYVNSEYDEPTPVGLFLRQVESGDSTQWRYRMQLNADFDTEGQLLGWLTQQTGKDLFAIGKELAERISCKKLDPPTEIAAFQSKSGDYMPALKMIGIRTVAVPPDQAEILHEPFRSSGFLVAPIVFGFPQIMFRFTRDSKEN